VEHRCWTKLALDRLPPHSRRRGSLAALRCGNLGKLRPAARNPLAPARSRAPSAHHPALGAQEKNWFAKPQEHPSRWASPRGLRVVLVPPALSRASAWYWFLEGSLPRRPATCARSPWDSRVHIARAANYETNLADILQQQYQHFAAAVPLKASASSSSRTLVEFHKDKVINNRPAHVGAVIDLCKREGRAEIIVAEGRATGAMSSSWSRERPGRGLEKTPSAVRGINHDEPAKLPNMGRLTGLDVLYVSKTVAQAEVFISLPKLKTHHWAGATCR